MNRCATEKKNPKKVIFLAYADFFYLGHKTLNVFEQLHINDGTLFLKTLSYNVSYRIDCLFKPNDEIYLFLDSYLFIMIISPIILKGSWRAIMIVCGVRLFIRLLFVTFFVPPP